MTAVEVALPKPSQGTDGPNAERLRLSDGPTVTPGSNNGVDTSADATRTSMMRSSITPS